MLKNKKELKWEKMLRKGNQKEVQYIRGTICTVDPLNMEICMCMYKFE